MQMVARCPEKNLEMQNNMNQLILTSALKDEHWRLYKIARRASYLVISHVLLFLLNGDVCEINTCQ